MLAHYITGGISVRFELFEIFQNTVSFLVADMRFKLSEIFKLLACKFFPHILNTFESTVQVQLSRCLSNQALPLEEMWGNGGIASPFLTSALDGVEWSFSCSGSFNPRERIPGSHCMAFLDVQILKFLKILQFCILRIFVFFFFFYF
jgi:hypothetical protein